MKTYKHISIPDTSKALKRLSSMCEGCLNARKKAHARFPPGRDILFLRLGLAAD